MFTIAVQNITETAEKVAPNVIKGKGSIEQYPNGMKRKMITRQEFE